MATASAPPPETRVGRSARNSVGSHGAVVAAVAIIVVVSVVITMWRTRSVEPARPALVRVEATSTYQFSTLRELFAASHLVVDASVVSVERGRLVGDPVNGGVISRIVTLRVDRQVSTARVPAASVVRVEEEGWLADGTPIMVDDVTPSKPGDRGIWFLHAVVDGEAPTFLVINSQGRYLNRAGRVEGGKRTDPLVQQLSSMTFGDLVAAVVALGSG